MFNADKCDIYNLNTNQLCYYYNCQSQSNEYAFANVVNVNHSYVYKYIEDLLKFDSCRPVCALALPEEYSTITTPLKVSVWEHQLRNHPDKNFVRYILAGIHQGFRLGFQHQSSSLLPAKANMHSARSNPIVVSDYLEKEVATGQVLAQVEGPIQISRFGVIPKSGSPNKWRLIVDLSYPHGRSVNDGVSKDLSSIQYATIDQAVLNILKLGPGTELAKVDVEQAYRNIPVHWEVRWLLGMEWEGVRFMDTTLPFGLRSAPKIFSAVADALEWIFVDEGVTFSLHFIDDFLTMGRASTGQCGRNLCIIKAVSKGNGTPLKEVKIVGPTTCLEFLGIELDTVLFEMRLSKEKIEALKKLLQQWEHKKACIKRDLLSLIGKLSHACKIVRPGRVFLRRMIETSAKALRPEHWVRLSEEFRSDLAWWRTFLQVWNGRSFMDAKWQRSQPDIVFASDASGAWGYGAVWGKQWLQGQWIDSWDQVNIATKELVPVVVGCAVWGAHWRQKVVLNQCDNMAVVDVIRSQKSKDPTIMHLLRCLHFICAYWEIELRVEHIPGKLNVMADAVSRNLLQVMETSDLERHPGVVPGELWQLLVVEKPDWLQPTWRSLLIASLTKASLQAQRGPTQ